jgi:hypothetical protein
MITHVAVPVTPKAEVGEKSGGLLGPRRASQQRCVVFPAPYPEGDRPTAPDGSISALSFKLRSSIAASRILSGAPEMAPGDGPAARLDRTKNGPGIQAHSVASSFSSYQDDVEAGQAGPTGGDCPSDMGARGRMNGAPMRRQ